MSGAQPSTGFAFTPGPWQWNEGRNVLYPVNPDPERGAVHTIIGCDGSFGFLASKLEDTLRESAGNYRLIEAAPELLQVLQGCLALLQARPSGDSQEAELVAAGQALVARIEGGPAA